MNGDRYALRANDQGVGKHSLENVFLGCESLRGIGRMVVRKMVMGRCVCVFASLEWKKKARGSREQETQLGCQLGVLRAGKVNNY